MSAMLLTACTGVALKAINTPSYWLSDLRRESNLHYGNKAHQRLDIYLPGDDIEARRQLIVFIYGGGWTTGARENYYFVADALTSAGYAVAIPDYIKYPGGEFPAFVQDVALSIAWLSANIERFAAIDDIIIMGHSAGAHTGALILTDPGYLAAHGLDARNISAFIGMAGPYGFTPKEEHYRNIFANLQDYTRMQPLHFANGDEPPMLLMHGSGDTTVLPANTRKFARKVNDLGGTAMTQFYDNKSHVSILLSLSRAFDQKGVILSDILNFLQAKLPQAPDAS
ncbi:MAG: alpha/beta hydrolase [Halioglobus sp.]|nr:alpha/beta hydrolase [Halioglobus sp.]